MNARRLAMTLAVLCAGSWLAAQPGDAPLELGFGGAGGRLTIQSGSCQIGKDKALGAFVLTATDKLPLTLEGPALPEGAREVRAVFRLQGDGPPTLSATLSLARRDAKDPGLRVVLSAAKKADAVTCQVTYRGKPLHDAKALAETLDWGPELHNAFTY